MKKLLTFISLIMFSSLFSFGQNAEMNVKEITCRITFYTPNIVRIVKFPSKDVNAPKNVSIVVTLAPQNVSVSRKESGSEVVLKSSMLSVVLNKRTGNVQFLHEGKNLLKEKSFNFIERTEGLDKGAYSVNVTYQLDKEEPIYGLGVLQDGKMNRRNTEKFMEQSNIEDYQYVIQSVKGWGLYWDNYSRAEFKDDANGMSFTAEVGDCVDYYFMYGKDADGVNALNRQLTGQVPLYPLWTYGYWQCRERYKSWDELLGVVNKYRELQVPLDGIIQDWQYWGSNYTWNSMDFITESFRDAPAMIDSVHKQNAHLMLSIWPDFGPMTKAYKELDAKGLLFDIDTWPLSGISHEWPPRMDYPSGVRVYDAYSAEARDIYWKYLKPVFDMGVDAWWMDSTDPDYFNSKDSDYDHITGLGSWRRVRNAFPICSVSGVYDKQRSVSSDKRVFIMTRSAFAGQQRYAAGYWSGDVNSSWDMLRKQIPAGLNFTMTGNPYFNTDIGGFFCGRYNSNGLKDAPHNPQFQELYVRWMQYALFCPVFRSHGTDAPREIYQFGKKGEPVYDAIEKMIRMRYELLPYIYSMAWQVTHNSQSFMRALSFDFASDKKVWNIPNEFMFGKSVLVAPIDVAQYTPEKLLDAGEANSQHVDFTQIKSIKKYLPAGTTWYDYWTGKSYKGGQTVSLRTVFDQVPIFVRSGSILPFAPVVQYTNGQKWDNLEIRIYPGENATFTLYEDEGDNYNYEKGTYSTIDFTWNDSKHEVIIGARQGNYPGMLQSRSFHVKLFNGTEQTIQYDGSEQTFKF